MLAANLIRARIAELETTEKETAKALGISMPTWKQKMRDKEYCFDLAEMNKLIAILGIENPTQIFFAEPVTQDVTNNG